MTRPGRLLRLAGGCLSGDDRRTAFGQVLRRYSLDELAQLFDVVKGDMTLVGPRPERSEFAAEFELSVYRYGDRFSIRVMMSSVVFRTEPSPVRNIRCDGRVATLQAMTRVLR